MHGQNHIKKGVTNLKQKPLFIERPSV